MRQKKASACSVAPDVFYRINYALLQMCAEKLSAKSLECVQYLYQYSNKPDLALKLLKWFDYIGLFGLYQCVTNII